ncbi:MAG: S4 domain-containing protein [Flavobacteriales bacterium]|nr:S4 domain-containing protein [Flavobacteriales bacterium]
MVQRNNTRTSSTPKPSFSSQRNAEGKRPYKGTSSSKPGAKSPYSRTERPAGGRPSRNSSFNNSERTYERPNRGASFGNAERSEKPSRSPFSQTRNYDDKKSSFSSYRADGKNSGAKRPDTAGKINFGNKKSVFLSKEKRAELEQQAKNEAQRTEEQQTRHQSYEGRYEDRMRASSQLSKDRLERTYSRPRPSRRATTALTTKKDDRDGIRLNKFIAHSGVCSRRDADMYIRSGSVQVNEKIVTEMG